ncbi:MAG: hypothetical protein RLO46_03740 [Pseudomonadales bacterium]
MDAACDNDGKIRRIVRRLTRDDLLILDPEQPWLDLEVADTLEDVVIPEIGSPGS